ncbi:MAG: hypothetical protein U0637_01530 [Phycisphaerales bacterium]
MKRPLAAIAACLAVCAVFSACAARPGAGSGTPATAPAPLEGWQSETFALPPGFAPGLPSGTESLRFPPGWRDPGSDNFWSYAFVMRINEAAPDAGRLREVLEQYYTGLMAAFAEGKELPPARVQVTRTAPHRFEAHMHLTDAFATFKPIDPHILIEVTPQTGNQSLLRIRVSPQPADHQVWRSLDAAIASILSQETATLKTAP